MTRATKPMAPPSRITTFFGISLHIIATLFFTRLILDTGTRIIYPFIPQFSAGLGLTVVVFSWLIFIRSISGLLGPIFGMLADRYGRRTIMTAGLLCQGVSVAGVALSWQWWAAVPMFLFGFSMSAFIPAEQAYISDKVHYARRGRALAAIEFSWAIAGIVSMPIIGWMIEIFGWRSPFWVLSGFSFIGAAIIWLRLPAVEHRTATRLTLSEMGQIMLKPNVLASMGAAMLLFIAGVAFITVWGIWLSSDFKLGAAALGGVATAIGLAELSGSGLSSLFIDRLGKKRGSQLGLILAALVFLLMPLTQANLVAAIAVLILMGLCIEFTVVSLIPLYSEQVPTARATVFSLVAFGVSIGASVGSPLTATLWEQFGLWAVSLMAIFCLTISLGLVTKFLSEAA